MFAVLGTLEDLCELDGKAKELLKGTKPISTGFDVKDGPQATIRFANGKCTVTEGCSDCDIKLPFSNVDKFNGMINGTVKPFPSKGFTKISFLLKTFTALTDRLEEVMRPTPEALKDPEFFNLSTTLTFYTITSAISQLGNHDPISTFSASNIDDGDIMMSIKDGPKANIRAKNHKLTTIKNCEDAPRAIMEFGSMQLASDLFNGKVNALACIGEGTIRMKGMASMLDNLNRILDRVALYLA